MEQLATGLNKAAQAMQTGEAEAEVGGPGASSDVDFGNLEDKQLFQLLEEAYDYRGGAKDRDGKSEMFRELLEKAEENSSGEEQWDINFRKYINHQDSGKKKKKRVSESNKKGGSLSNLSCLSDFESSTCCKSSSKNKKSRSSVSSRSREGGSLPPTKFENVMMFEAAPPSSLLPAWDTGGQAMPEEGCIVEPGELQPLLVHSTSDSQIRKRGGTAGDSRDAVTIDMEGLGECDTDSNKTEVEEIEMVDMEGRGESGDCDGETEDMLAARHRLETRHDWTESENERDRASASQEMDENGNPTTGRHIHPIMTNNVRPVSIYRHTPVFRPQKLTVPHVQNSSSTNSYSTSNPSVTGPPPQETEKTSKGADKKRSRRKKEEEKNVVKAEDIEGYRGNTQDLDSLLQFIDGEETKKKNKKAMDKLAEKNNKKVSNKSDNGKDDQKLRKKKEKSQEKDLIKSSVTKKLSIDTVDNDDEDVEVNCDEKRANSEEVVNSVRASESPEKDPPYPPMLETVQTVSAPSSNDSGHVSGGPCSLPSISSTKEMSIASSPPLDIDPIEFSEDNYKDITDIAVTNHNEFTKVTKKQRKKKKRGSERVLYPPGSHEEDARSSSQGPESGDQWFRGYRAMRGSREAVTGTKSTCSVPPSEASDTDDHDSVHSLPVGSTRTKVSVSVASVSSGHTPHASYADIARHAAALQTQQQGQQQHAVYREQLQYRENTPNTNKESVSSTDSNDYFYNPDLDASFPPVQFHSDYQESEHNNSSQLSNNNSVNISENNNSGHSTQSQVTDQSQSNPTSDHSSDNQHKTIHTNSRSQLRQNKSEPSLSAPPVVILQNDQTDTEPSGFTFGFEVNESLLAMSFENDGKDEDDSDTLNDSDNIDSQNGGSSNKGLVCNQTFEDNEMMKKLLLCSNNRQDDENDNEEDFDDADVIVEPQQEKSNSLSSFCNQVESLENLNFNYEVIVKFVKQAWEMVNRDMKNGSGSPVCYYGSS